MFSRRDLLRRHERLSCHLERRNDSLTEPLNGTDQCLMDQDDPPHVTSDALLSSAATAQQNTGIFAYQSPHSLGASAHFDSSLPSLTTSDNHSASPPTQTALERSFERSGKPSMFPFLNDLHATRLLKSQVHRENPTQYTSVSGTSHGPSVHECPTIFPSPQLSLSEYLLGPIGHPSQFLTPL